jgi:hypothetical protein
MPAAAAQEIHGYFCTNEVLTGVEAPAYIDPHTRAVLPLAAPGFTLGFSRSQIVRKFAVRRISFLRGRWVRALRPNDEAPHRVL